MYLLCLPREGGIYVEHGTKLGLRGGEILFSRWSPTGCGNMHWYVTNVVSKLWRPCWSWCPSCKAWNESQVLSYLHTNTPEYDTYISTLTPESYIPWIFSSRVHAYLGWFHQHFHEKKSSFPHTYICISTQFFEYMFKLGIKWPTAAHLSTFHWKSGEKIDFQI
jgi:hypothetical protein